MVHHIYLVHMGDGPDAPLTIRVYDIGFVIIRAYGSCFVITIRAYDGGFILIIGAYDASFGIGNLEYIPILLVFVLANVSVRIC
jgi:hypothetical protein